MTTDLKRTPSTAQESYCVPWEAQLTLLLSSTTIFNFLSQFSNSLHSSTFSASDLVSDFIEKREANLLRGLSACICYPPSCYDRYAVYTYKQQLPLHLGAIPSFLKEPAVAIASHPPVSTNASPPSQPHLQKTGTVFKNKRKSFLDPHTLLQPLSHNSALLQLNLLKDLSMLLPPLSPSHLFLNSVQLRLSPLFRSRSMVIQVADTMNSRDPYHTRPPGGMWPHQPLPVSWIPHILGASGP